MSEKSSYESRLGERRSLQEDEKSLIEKLLNIAGKANKSFCLETMEVQEMSDGGMGSLYIVSPNKEAKARVFGGRIAEFQYEDSDGTTILASLNVDKDGDLFELDVWRVDYNPVIRLAPPKIP